MYEHTHKHTLIYSIIHLKSYSFNFYYICLFVCLGGTHTIVYMEARGQLVEVSSLLSQCESWNQTEVIKLGLIAISTHAYLPAKVT